MKPCPYRREHEFETSRDGLYLECRNCFTPKPLPVLTAPQPEPLADTAPMDVPPFYFFTPPLP